MNISEFPNKDLQPYENLGLNDGAEEEFVRSIPQNFTCRIYRLSGIESSLVAIGCR